MLSQEFSQVEQLKIFISGTQQDMEAERTAVSRAVNAVQVTTGIRAEEVLAKPQPARAWIEEAIRSCNIFIGIYSHRYGWVIPEDDISATEFEFNLAHKLRKPILIWVRKLREEEESYPDFQRQEQFLQRVSDFSTGYMRQEFGEIGELQAWVADALRETLVRIVQRQTGEADPSYGFPAGNLLKTYLQEIANQTPYVSWSNQSDYIDRTVAEADNLFARTVVPYSSLSSGLIERREPEALESTLAREGKLILLGEPGMGKTTSLLHLAWEAANQELAANSLGDQGEIGIPIYIELKYYTGEKELEALLARRVNELLRGRNLVLAPNLEESVSKVKIWLAQPDTRFLLLLDGLNEVRPEYHREVRGLLKSLLYSPHGFVIACRERDYDQSLRDCASAFTLQPLQYQEVHDYLVRRLADKGARLFFSDISGDGKMLSLAGNPLMLWLIGVVAQTNQDARLPANRGQLFQQFISHMPKLRASEGISLRTPSDIVRAALAKLGFEMQERRKLSGELGEVRTYQLPIGGLRLEDVLAQAKEWRFLKSDGELDEPVEFLHQLFLEYFSASYLEEQLRSGRSYTDVIGNRQFDGWWAEVITMLAGISEQPAKLVKWLCSQVLINPRGWSAALLVARCLETSRAADDAEATGAVVDALIFCFPHLKYLEEQQQGETIRVFRRIRGPAIKALIAALKNANEEVRAIAYRVLVSIGTPSVEQLIETLRDAGPEPRAFAADALGEIGDERAVGPLVSLLRDKNEGARQRASAALGLIGGSAVELLTALLQDGDSGSRQIAAETLGRIDTPEVIEPLLATLRDKNEDVRRAAATALGGIRSWEVVPSGRTQIVELLTGALQSESAEERSFAAYALGRIRNREAIESLVAALQDDDPDVRWRAVSALGELQEQGTDALDEYAKPLIAALGDKDTTVSSKAMAILTRIAFWSLLPLSAAVRDEDSNIRCRAASIIDKLPVAYHQDFIQLLILGLKDENRDVRRLASIALGKLESGQAVEPLIAALNDDDVEVRALVADALGRIGDERAVEPLISSLQGEKGRVRSMAVFALGKIADPRAVEPLLNALKDEEAQVRLLAATALRVMLDNGTLPAFKRMARDLNARAPSSDAERLARKALRRILL